MKKMSKPNAGGGAMKGGGVFTQQTVQATGRSVPVKKGDNPKSAMIDGPFGGKKKA